MHNIKITRKKNNHTAINSKQELNPGPGTYNIGLPLIRPTYQAIKKNDQTIILKVNDHCQSANFRSNLERFPVQKELSPGPAYYEASQSNQITDRQKKKMNQRYFDLLEFMNGEKSKLESIPNYKVEYGQQHIESLKAIKNSYKQHRNDYLSLKRKKKTKQSTSNLSQASVVSIRSGARYEKGSFQTNQQHSMTIDYPPQTKLQKKSLEEDEKMLLHRRTLFNRNMLGMMLVRGSSKQKSQLN